MRLTIAAIGRLKDGPERALFDRYTGLLDTLGKTCAMGPLHLAELPEAKGQSADARRRDEAGRLLAATASAQMKFVLDERGRTFTSADFAHRLGSLRDDGVREIAFLIGGADGHGPETKASADLTLSLSPLTLPHGLARLVLAEQLYRAVTILTGHPYHRA